MMDIPAGSFIPLMIFYLHLMTTLCYDGRVCFSQGEVEGGMGWDYAPLNWPEMISLKYNFFPWCVVG